MTSSTGRRTRAGIRVQGWPQRHDGQNVLAQPQNQAALEAFERMDARLAEADSFDDRMLGQGETMAAGLDDQSRCDRERQRDLQREAGALPGPVVSEIEPPIEFDIVAHDIHADAAAGNAGDGWRRSRSPAQR